MERDRADRGLEDAARRAAERIRGLIDGSMPPPAAPQRVADAHIRRAAAVRRGALGGFDRDAVRRRASNRGSGTAIGR